MYKTGDIIWYATFESRETQVPCPVCYGNKTVTVILGNDDHVAVECRYCEVGFQGARGYVIEYVKEPRAEQMTITGRRIEENNGVEEVEYRSDHYCLNSTRIFDTEPEALACAEKMEEVQESRPKYKDEKSYTWNAGYHMKQAASKLKEAEYHRQKAVMCKSKSKE